MLTVSLRLALLLAAPPEPERWPPLDMASAWRELLSAPAIVQDLDLSPEGKIRVGLVLAAAQDRESQLVFFLPVPPDRVDGLDPAVAYRHLAEKLSRPAMDRLLGFDLAARGSALAFFEPLRTRLDVSGAQLDRFRKALFAAVDAVPARERYGTLNIVARRRRDLGEGAFGAASRLHDVPPWPVVADTAALERIAWAALTPGQQAEIRSLRRPLPPGAAVAPITALELCETRECCAGTLNCIQSESELCHYLRSPRFRKLCGLADGVVDGIDGAIGDCEACHQLAYALTTVPQKFRQDCAHSQAGRTLPPYMPRHRRMLALAPAEKRGLVEKTWTKVLGPTVFTEVQMKPLRWTPHQQVMFFHSPSKEELKQRGEWDEARKFRRYPPKYPEIYYHLDDNQKKTWAELYGNPPDEETVETIRQEVEVAAAKAAATMLAVPAAKP